MTAPRPAPRSPRCSPRIRPFGRPTRRACLLMADIEEADGHQGAVREWLGRAARAPRDKAWVAEGVISDRWAPVSPSGALDAFVWRTPDERFALPAEPPAAGDGARSSRRSQRPLRPPLPRRKRSSLNAARRPLKVRRLSPAPASSSTRRRWRPTTPARRSRKPSGAAFGSTPMSDMRRVAGARRLDPRTACHVLIRSSSSAPDTRGFRRL